MIPEIKNLYNIADFSCESKEVFYKLSEGNDFTMEQIVSYGQASPPDFWYDQDKNEWVALITGSAVLEFTNGEVKLKAGDYLTIPAHLKHRVSMVSKDAIWLGLHFKND